ncbi:hypothetical protein E2C01_081186 [Portunus trituberculatus]|uniref:Uncharacterized protein n=1 Tax=Portunus trituberculatus TaxID=210409 RepID=A0A5B7ILJ6_PORTR|nr:hypothetical protein [Portunus trituberculatus]
MPPHFHHQVTVIGSPLPIPAHVAATTPPASQPATTTTTLPSTHRIPLTFYTTPHLHATLSVYNPHSSPSAPSLPYLTALDTSTCTIT